MSGILPTPLTESAELGVYLACAPAPRSVGTIRRELVGYDALSLQERRRRIDDARASNPRRHRLFAWVDPIGENLRIAGTLWTVVEEANVAQGSEAPIVYQVALSAQRGALILGPFRAPAETPRAGGA